MSFRGFFDGVGTVFSTAGLILDELNGNAKDKRDAEARRVAMQETYSLSCKKCSRLAEPLPDSGNRYSCACGHRFAAARHDC